MPGGGARSAVPLIAASSVATRIVILSDDESREGVLELLEAGAMAYLRKGASMTHISRTLTDALAAPRRRLGFTDLLVGDSDAMKRRTRNYARRQLTWMRKLPDVTQIDVTDRPPVDIAAEIAGRWLQGAI